MAGAPKVDQILGVAEILAVTLSEADLCRIVDDHNPDAGGHCRGCRYPSTAAPVWPCRLRQIADEARRIGARAGSA